MKEKVLGYKLNFIAMVVIFMIALLITGLTGNAAADARIDIRESSVSVKLGETAVLDLTYQMPAGKTVQLAVVTTDDTITAAVVADQGNQKATLSVAGLKLGSCVVAVYEATDPAVVDYVTVRCGFAEEGSVYTLNEGDAFTTVYDDRMISYNSLMKAKNADQLAIENLEVERNTGIDALIVKGKLWQENRSTAGLLTFYANFYNASGELLERTPYYLKNTGAGSKAELIWYIPKGCTRIVVE